MITWSTNRGAVLRSFTTLQKNYEIQSIHKSKRDNQQAWILVVIPDDLS